MKVPAILADLYRKLHERQKEENILVELFPKRETLSAEAVAKAIVENATEMNEVKLKIDMIQLALRQQEIGILEDFPEA